MAIFLTIVAVVLLYSVLVLWAFWRHNNGKDGWW